ncbi:hypothetical protein EMCRGX_G029544 [Ephydatia muelleri]
MHHWGFQALSFWHSPLPLSIRQRSTALWKQHAPQLDVRLVVLPRSQHWIVMKETLEGTTRTVSVTVCDTTIDPAHVSTAPLFSNETGPPSNLSIADSTGSFMALDDPLGTEVSFPATLHVSLNVALLENLEFFLHLPRTLEETASAFKHHGRACFTVVQKFASHA